MFTTCSEEECFRNEHKYAGNYCHFTIQDHGAYKPLPRCEPVYIKSKYLRTDDLSSLKPDSW